MPDPILVVVTAECWDRDWNGHRCRICVEAQPKIEAATVIAVESLAAAIEVIVSTAAEILPRNFAASSLAAAISR